MNTKSENKKENDWYNELTKDQKEGIKIGLQQLEKGKGIPHNEVRKRIDKRLNKT